LPVFNIDASQQSGGGERPRNVRAAKQRLELVPLQLIEMHSVPLAAGAELQDIE
jgi:hypothetical protein